MSRNERFCCLDVERKVGRNIQRVELRLERCDSTSRSRSSWKRGGGSDRRVSGEWRVRGKQVTMSALTKEGETGFEGEWHTWFLQMFCTVFSYEPREAAMITTSAGKTRESQSFVGYFPCTEETLFAIGWALDNENGLQGDCVYFRFITR